MVSSVNGQDEPNRTLWLATRARKMELSCPLGTTRQISNKSFIDQAFSVEMLGYWPRSFLASLWTSTPSRSINTQKKELGQYPARVSSHLDLTLGQKPICKPLSYYSLSFRQLASFPASECRFSRRSRRNQCTPWTNPILSCSIIQKNRSQKLGRDDSNFPLNISAPLHHLATDV